MNKKWLMIIAIIAVIGLWAGRMLSKKSADPNKSSISKFEGQSYWTCPMHPQIHADKAGECPICHMKLVQVKAQQSQQVSTDSRATISVTPNQLALIGVQKEIVEKMDLTAKIAVSGRLISPSTVAFQVYESDLKYIKAGLTFRGESSFAGEGEIVGTISSVDTIVDPTSRTVRVIGSIRKGPAGLISETTFRGNVEIVLKDRVSIPESSVMHTGSGDLVYIFSDGNNLKPNRVKLGIKAESYFEVLDGLKPGDEISSGPNFLIDSEAKIRGTNDHANH